MNSNIEKPKLKTYWPLILSVGINVPWLIRVYRTQDGSSFSLVTQLLYVMMGVALVWSYRKQRGLALADSMVRLIYALLFTVAAATWGGGW